MTSVSTVRKHTAPPASASEIRKALGITQADISTVRKAFVRLGIAPAKSTKVVGKSVPRQVARPASKKKGAPRSSQKAR